VVRSTVPSDRIELGVRRAMLDVDRLQPIFHLQPMTTFIALSVAQRTFILTLVAAFGALALALAMAGVYGVVSYVIEQRRREVGLRLALGASPTGVLRLILRQILTVAMIGVGVGLIVAVGARDAFSTLLFDVSPLDLETAAGVAALMIAAALLASYVPIARVARLDPATVLRSQ
jgi:ABC-type antimicrobial peptide transport system permease subunit